VDFVVAEAQRGVSEPSSSPIATLSSRGMNGCGVCAQPQVVPRLPAAQRVRRSAALDLCQRVQGTDATRYAFSTSG
jgi:hypothetical protein